MPQTLEDVLESGHLLLDGANVLELWLVHVKAFGEDGFTELL